MAISNSENQIGLKLMCLIFAESNNFSQGTSEPEKDAAGADTAIVVELEVLVYIPLHTPLHAS